jgi:hypothetical protein
MRSMSVALILSGCLLLGGCGAAALGLVQLTAGQADELSFNLEETVDIQQELATFTFLAATGGLSNIESYDYVPPSEENGWVGSITTPSGMFPFGNGALTIDFTTTGDAGPVDPYGPGVILVDDDQVSVDADVDFLGQSGAGYDVHALGDFLVTTTNNGPVDVSALVDGDFVINHGDYTSTFNADQLALDFNLVTSEITNMVGNLGGSIDLPDFAIDADFDIEALGQQLDFAIDALATDIHYLIDIADL